MRLPDEVFEVEVFFFAAARRELDAAVERDLLDDEVRDLAAGFFAVDRLDEDFAPADVLFDAALALAVLRVDDDFAPPEVFFAVERLPAVALFVPDFAPLAVFLFAVDFAVDAFFTVDFAPPDAFLFADPPVVFRPEVLLAADDLLLDAELLPEPDEVFFFAVELLPAVDFFAVDFDFADVLFEVVFFGEVFEAVFFFVVAMLCPPKIRKMLRHEFSKIVSCVRTILRNLFCEGTKIRDRQISSAKNKNDV